MPAEFLPPQDVIAYVLADLAIILVAARLVGGLFVRLGQPRVVGEIIAGILIGPTLLGGQLAAAPSPTAPDGVAGVGLVNDVYPLQAFAFLNLVGQIALVLYMFLVGLDLDQRLLQGKGRQISIMAIAVVAVPLGLAFATGGVFGAPPREGDGGTTTPLPLFLG